jgi:regulatory protein
VKPDLAQLRAAVARIEHGAGAPDVGGVPAADGASAAEAEPEVDAAPGSAAARDPHAVARTIALRQLANTPKTRRQLEAALAKRGCDPEVAASVLDRLTEVGLVDDLAFTEVYVRSKQTSRRLSRSALARELETKGVAKDTVADVLGRVSDAEEEDRARQLIRSRLTRLDGLDRQVKVRRLAGLLARKGYPSRIAGRVIFEELDAIAEHRRD